MSEHNGHLDRGAIEAVQDIQVQELDVPEWGGRVYYRGMMGSERDVFEQRQGASVGNYNDFRARLAAYCLCDAAGVLLFSEADVPMLARKSARALDRIFAVGLKASGLSKEDVQELKKN